MATTSQITLLLENDVRTGFQYEHTDTNTDLHPFLPNILPTNPSPLLQLLLENDESMNVREEISNFGMPISSQGVDPLSPLHTEIDNTHFLLAPLLDGFPETGPTLKPGPDYSNFLQNFETEASFCSEEKFNPEQFLDQIPLDLNWLETATKLKPQIQTQTLTSTKIGQNLPYADNLCSI